MLMGSPYADHVTIRASDPHENFRTVGLRVLAWLAAAAFADPLTVAADHWVGDADQAVAEGSVDVVFGPEEVRGARARVELATRRIVVEEGTWRHAGVGAMSFATLEIAWDGGWTASASDAHFTGSPGGRPLSVHGDTLRWLADGTLAGTGVVVSPCDCDRPPISVQAKDVRVRVGDEASFRGGWIRLFDVPVVPVPAGTLPLSRRSGLLPPSLGYGDDGFRASIPLYLTLGPSGDATFTPEVRTERSERLLGEGRYAIQGGTGIFEGAAGWDRVTGSPREAASLAHQASRGTTGAAVRAQVLSDPDYLSDYSDVFLARTTPWIESRAWVAGGPAEAWLDGFQYDPTAIQRVGAAVAMPGQALPGGFATDLELASLAGFSDTLSGAGGWVGAAAAVRRATWLGPLRATPELRGGMSGDAAYPGAEDAAWGEARLELAVPVWRDLRHGRETIEPVVSVTGGSGQLADPPGSGLLLGDRGAPPLSDHVPPWSVDPELRWRRGGAIEIRGGGSFTAEHIGVAASGTFGAGEWHGFAQAEQADVRFAAPNLAYAGVGWARGVTSASVAGLYATPPELAQPLSAAMISVGFAAPASLRWQASTLIDPVAPEWKSGLLDVRWTHPARCLSVDGQLRVDSDLPLPTFKLSFDWQPAPATP
jgi:hypothetical protein